MKLVCTLLLIGFIYFLVFNSVDADLEVNTTSNNVLDTESVGSLKNDGIVKEKLGKINNGNGSEKNVDLGKDNASKQVESKEAEKDGRANVRGSESEGEKRNELKNAGDHASQKQDDNKSETVTGRKDSIRGEECDSSSYSCNIEEESLVACLRVPGNESPDLSLLVQNKGKGPLSVSISAPKNVKLEKRQVQLKEKENQKIKVSFSNSDSDNFITLKTKNGKCDLDFKDLIEHSTDKEVDFTSQFKYFTPSRSLAIIFLATLLISASLWACMNYKKQLIKNGSKYQRLDMDLPISSGGKIKEDANDGWDNNWDDKWDDDDEEDEEAPKTPVVPVTPSFSSKHLASRRSNKEGWKD